MYLPSDIKSPAEIAKGSIFCAIAYGDVFGKSEYEEIAQVLVEASQRAGGWVALPLSSFVSAFESRSDPEREAAYRIRQMYEESPFLAKEVTKEDEKFRLTETAIERLVSKFPAD